MLIKNHIFFQITLFFLFTNLLFSNISGIVFQDLPVNGSTLNVYGVKDSNELGVQGILVTAYPSGIQTTTDSNGSWSLPTTQNSRIEFSNIPSYLKESPSANVNNSSVQFINNGQTDVTFGLHNPADFSNTANPLYVSNIQQNGTHIGSTIPNLQTVHYSAQKLNDKYKNDFKVTEHGETPLDTVTMNNMGSIWAKSYQPSKKRLFVASMLQRHVGFAHSPADIYVIDYASGVANNIIGYFSLQGKIPDNGGSAIDLGTVDRTTGQSDNELFLNPTQPNIDLDAYAKVGKMSYGGMDIDPINNELWLINLNQKSLISIDISSNFNSISTTATTNQYLLSNLTNISCTGGSLRPWALKINEGKAYIGAVCDASISQSSHDLKAYVLSFDLNSTPTTLHKEVSFPLDYNRQLKKWNAWKDTYIDSNSSLVLFGTIYPQPILSDIEFDAHNNMYLSFMDRYATQLGSNNYKAISGTNQLEGAYNYGELLKICNNNGIYEKEGTGSCLRSNYHKLNINEYFNDQGGDHNQESALGALAQLKGSNQLLATTVDPHPENDIGQRYWFTQGTHTLNENNGSIDNWYGFAYTASSGVNNPSHGFNSKANGMGDIELITDASPIEIGDRVWLDSNLNGVQDANETTIAGVRVNLVCSGAIDANVTTDSNGNYLFSNDTRGTTPSSQQFNIAQLVENNENNCSIVVPNVQGNNQQSSLTGYKLTSPLLGEGINKTLNDSNAHLNGNDAIITIYPNDIPISGSNNHSFDIGFFKASARIPVPVPVPVPVPNPTPIVNPNPSPSPTPSLDNNGTLILGNYLWNDSDHDGIQDNNESGINGVTVNLYDNANCSGNILSTTITSNAQFGSTEGLYQFSNLTAGTYCIEFMLDTNQTVSPNSEVNGIRNSDANRSGFITNINLVADDLNEDIGVYTPSNRTIVEGETVTSGDENCSCSDYTESSISIFNNVLTLLFLIISTSLLGLFFTQRERLSL